MIFILCTVHSKTILFYFGKSDELRLSRRFQRENRHRTSWVASQCSTEHFTHYIYPQKSSSSSTSCRASRRVESSWVAPAAIVPVARAPLSSNYRSNGAARRGDPTPTSICRLALIQLLRRQLPRWYTCGRFIASVIPAYVSSHPLSSLCDGFVRSFAPSSPLLFLFLSFSPSFYISPSPSRMLHLMAIIVLLAVDARDRRSAFHIYRRAHDRRSRWREKNDQRCCVLLHCANSHDGDSL